jgi:hypothetical protein
VLALPDVREKLDARGTVLLPYDAADIKQISHRQT